MPIIKLHVIGAEAALNNHDNNRFDKDLEIMFKGYHNYPIFFDMNLNLRNKFIQVYTRYSMFGVKKFGVHHFRNSEW